MAITKYKEDFILFAEAGFIAVNQADEDAALKLFDAAALLDAKNILPKLGVGYLHLHKLELKQAIEKFDEVLNIDPDNEMAKAFKGLSYSLMPNAVTKGEKILEETCHSTDPLIKQMSQTAMEFVDKFVKPKPGPAGKSK
jgi:tetratricopeptide (TPR) repeat protein